jgi:hypothetical protein
MVVVEEITTYPFIVRCWSPPGELHRRNRMIEWLDAHVEWDRNIELELNPPTYSGARQKMNWKFRVHSLEDVGIVKLSL